MKSSLRQWPPGKSGKGETTAWNVEASWRDRYRDGGLILGEVAVSQKTWCSIMDSASALEAGLCWFDSSHHDQITRSRRSLHGDLARTAKQPATRVTSEGDGQGNSIGQSGGEAC